MELPSLQKHEGPPLSESPLPVGATHNSPPKKGTFGPPPHDVNYFLTTGTIKKIPKEKPVDQVAMKKTLDQICKTKISPHLVFQLTKKLGPPACQ